MNAPSILDRVRIAPSAVVSFLVKSGCAISGTCRKKEPEKDSLHRITICEGLVPDAEPPFLKLANVDVPNDNAKRSQITWPMLSDKP